MPKKKLGVAVIGAGWVAGEHIEAYLKNPHVELKCVHSRFQSELDEKKARFGLTCDLWVDRLEELLQRDDIDIVSICTINFLHAEQAIMAAEHGKHLLIEKPICITLDELKAIKEAVKKAGVIANSGYVLRWNPLLQTAKRLVDKGDLGKLWYVACDYWHELVGEWKTKIKTAGSAWLMGGSHAIDAVRWMMADDPVVEITAYGQRPFRRKDYEYDPNAAMLMKFKSGTISKVAVSVECKMPYVFNLEVLGTKGALRNDKLWCDRFEGQTDWITIPTILPDSADVTHHPFQGEINYLVDCVRKNKPSMLHVDDSGMTHEICFAAEISAKEGCPVKLPLL